MKHFLHQFADDYRLMRAAIGTGAPSAPVPDCPGWTLADLAYHVAEVYLQKAAAIRDGEWPTPWPPDLTDELPAVVLERAYHEISAQLATHRASDFAPSWYRPDRTAGFWMRRMAQETVIHRIDAERAIGAQVSPVPDRIAADGIDEVLRVFLSYEYAHWPDSFADCAAVTVPVTITVGERSWTVRPDGAGMPVSDGPAADAGAVLAGSPMEVLRWAWGRGGQPDIAGDPAQVARLRGLLAVATQ